MNDLCFTESLSKLCGFFDSKDCLDGVSPNLLPVLWRCAGSRDDNNPREVPSHLTGKDPVVPQRRGWEAEVPHVDRVRRGTERAKGFRLLIWVFRAIKAPDSFSISLDGADPMAASQSVLLGTLPAFQSLAAGF